MRSLTLSNLDRCNDHTYLSVNKSANSFIASTVYFIRWMTDVVDT